MNAPVTREWRGIAASPGYAIARALVLKRETYTPDRRTVADPQAEEARFRAAVSAAREELAVLRQNALEQMGEQKAEIFDGHLLLLEDPELVDAVAEQIRGDRVNAEFALDAIAGMFIDTFRQMDNELLRARAADIRDVADRVMDRLRGVTRLDLASLKEPCVIIAHDLTPSDTARMNRQAVRGFVTEIGSRTSHSAIMARSLGMPAVVGAGDGIMAIPDGATVIVDAMDGLAIAHPAAAQLARYEALQEEYERRKAALAKLVNMPTRTKDGHAVKLMANIGQLEEVDDALANGAEGIGLFRTEFLYMDRQTLPDEDEQFQVYKHVLEKMGDKPVVIRTLDIGGDKELPYLDLPKESNPFLGLRAIRLCLDREDLFRSQLRALLRASSHGNLKIMFPMIAVMEEWQRAKAILLEEKARVVKQGVDVPETLEIGMMVEVPAAALNADAFAREVDFFSIGTNDLIQYTMAADRMNESLTYLYQPDHPAITRLVRMVIESAAKAGKWAGMCGEMAGDPAAIPRLVGLGLHEFSMSAGSILPAREQIRQLEYRALAAQYASEQQQ